MIQPPLPLKKPFYYALGLHGGIILFLLIISFSFPEKIFQEQSVSVINANVLNSLPSQAAQQQPEVKSAPPIPVPKQPTPKPQQQKPMHRRTITKEQAVEQTVVKNATIDKKEHLARQRQKKRAEIVHEKQLRAKELARQKQLAHQKELAHEKAVAEQSRLKALHAQQVQGTIDRYQAMITQAISEHWLIPPGVDKQLSCKLNIQLAPDGSVLNVTLIESSNNVLLDRSAVAAVYKSSPLPVPSDPDAFDSFRNFDLIVKPEDIIS